MSISEFKKIVFSTFSGTDWEIGAFRESGVTPNFHSVTLSNDGSIVSLVCNLRREWAICEVILPTALELTFMNMPVLSDLLCERAGIRVLDLKLLNSDFELGNELFEGDVSYWKPSTNGEGLFNWWD